MTLQTLLGAIAPQSSFHSDKARPSQRPSAHLAYHNAPWEIEPRDLFTEWVMHLVHRDGARTHLLSMPCADAGDADGDAALRRVELQKLAGALIHGCEMEGVQQRAA